MRGRTLATTATLAASAHASSLAQVCTTSQVRAAIPANGTFNGLSFDRMTVTANAVYNESVSGQTMFPDATFDFCNVTFAYSHDGLDDQVMLQYWLPSPQDFQNRWLSTGGMAYAINGGLDTTNLAGGVMYGAVSGITDGGFGGFGTSFDTIMLLANGTLDLNALYMFGYQGHYEMAEIGKAFSRNFYNVSSCTKIYSYYQGCSEGGREGWSQVQRFKDEFDGAIIGAPAFRYAQQQTNHLFSNVVENTLGYYPPSCELDKILNETIAFCDALDGNADGVVARTDLCQLNFDMTSIIGKEYYCAEETSTSLGLGFSKSKRQSTSTTPAQNGTVSAQGVAVAQAILDGLHDSQGRRAYLSYQIAAEFTDAATSYNSTSGTWGLDIASTGGEFVARFINLVEASNLDSLEGVTYDTLRDWMAIAWQKYGDSMQTNNPDLTPYQSGGGKILTFHGESDPSVPTASSVHFYESVRSIMYPELSFNASVSAMNDWYHLYLVPGAAHCGLNSLQPNGPWPQTNLQVMINWVENGVNPTTLNATVLEGDYKGENRQICAWPLRPFWTDNATNMECEYDQASIDTWKYDFNAYDLPLY